MGINFDIQTLKPVIYNIPEARSNLTRSDYWGAVKVRWGIGRNNYRVAPGLYKVGKPDNQADVFVSANYKLSFDTLRKNLDSLNAWILVLDTKGINVWCAAGKGTFGTENLVRGIKNSSLDTIVKHRRIIVPQLGAVGVAAHTVREFTGFRVIYGPVCAKDIKAFIENGFKADAKMRKVTFPFFDRAKLIPVDMMQGKYRLLIAAFTLFFLSGLDQRGFLFNKMIATGLYPLTNIFSAYLAGIVVAPLLLPVIPFRAFALKGAFWGIVSTMVISYFIKAPLIESFALGLINVAVASFMTMNFTGSSTYTSLSGVKKEMKWAVPLQIAFVSTGLILFIISKLI